MDFFHGSKKDPADHEGPVVIATYDNPIEGSLARGVLEQAGIQCFLYDENAFNVRGGGFPSLSLLGGMRLVVAAADAEDAKALLSQTGEGKGAPLR